MVPVMVINDWVVVLLSAGAETARIGAFGSYVTVRLSTCWLPALSVAMVVMELAPPVRVRAKLKVPSGLTVTSWLLTVRDLIPPVSVALPLTLSVARFVYDPLASAEIVSVGFVVSVAAVTVTTALLAADTLPAASLAQA